MIKKDSTREITLDVHDNISFNTIYEAINAAVGTNYSGWMRGGWPGNKQDLPFWIWFPKLSVIKDGKPKPAVLDCVNTISADGNEFIYDDLKKGTPAEVDASFKTSPVLIFAKEPNGGPYIFRGVYIKNIEKSKYQHHVLTRIGTKVKLLGQPSDRIEILDDFRSF